VAHDLVDRSRHRFCSGRGVLVNDPLREGGHIEMLARYPHYAIAGEVEWLPSSLVRGPTKVPVVMA
jgi:hypothetical protein